MVDLFRETPVTGTLTVTVQLAFAPPAEEVAVIVAVPGPIATTLPEALTVATSLLLLVQFTLRAVPSEVCAGDTVACSVSLPPSTRERLVLFRATETTVTVYVQLAPPTAVVPVITATPAFLAVYLTTGFWIVVVAVAASISTTEGSLLVQLQVKSLSVAGVMVDVMLLTAFRATTFFTGEM